MSEPSSDSDGPDRDASEGEFTGLGTPGFHLTPFSIVRYPLLLPINAFDIISPLAARFTLTWEPMPVKETKWLLHDDAK